MVIYVSVITATAGIKSFWHWELYLMLASDSMVVLCNFDLCLKGERIFSYRLFCPRVI